MTARKPTPSAFRKAFIRATAVLALVMGGTAIENAPKNPDTDTQTISTFQNSRTGEMTGYNISPLDQFWRAGLAFKAPDEMITDFFAATRDGDLWRVRTLMDAGLEKSVASDSAFQSMLDYALIDAVLASDRTLARYLLQKGADVNAQKGEPLRIAVWGSDIGMIDELRAAAVNLAINDAGVLISAAVFGQKDVVTLMMSSGTITLDDQISVALAVSETGDRDMLRHVLSFSGGATGNNSYALLQAVTQGRDGAIENLLFLGADPNDRNGDIMRAALEQSNDMILHRLLAMGGNAQIDDNKGLFDAVLAGNLERTRLLVSFGADPHARGGDIMELARVTDDADMRKVLRGEENFSPAPKPSNNWRY